MSLLKMEYNLYAELKRMAGGQPISLFNEHGDFVEVEHGSSFKFLIPKGFYSSMSVKTNLQLETLTTTDNKITSINPTNAPKLYPLQRKVVSEVISNMRKMIELKRPLYITLHLACGFGKTITTCYLMATHGRKTVICVPNKMLIHQWKTQVEAVGLEHKISIDGVSSLLKDLKTQSPDVLIVVSRHLTNDAFCKYINKHYDLFILDESHTYNLMNNTAVTRFLAYYPPMICYFLTATPRPANRIYCNSVVNVAKLSDLKKTINVVDSFFEPYSTDNIRHMIKRLDGPSNKYHIYTEKLLSVDEPRNQLILNTLVEEFKSGSINRILVITKLREHMVFFYERLLDIFGSEIVFLGDAQNRRTPEIVKSIKELNRFIFVSTLFYSGTGLDIPSLDSLFICSAVINNMQIEQLLGRVCRETELLDRTVYVFPSTSIKEIKYTIGNFLQRIISLSVDKLGFKQESYRKHQESVTSSTCTPVSSREEHVLNKIFNSQNR
ncbi:DNA helicase [Skunkpox virus]|uniref:DNA helicase n=1 Tax=Skunkpox virus TaxID=160796 RepID=A0A1C9KBX0_9POXV|nr:DNA helicase [Skunkpox virus]AOP31616.1 DNA helicase [Skunkpox virus]